jgi:hypothetical protein
MEGHNFYIPPTSPDFAALSSPLRASGLPFLEDTKLSTSGNEGRKDAP